MNTMTRTVALAAGLAALALVGCTRQNETASSNNPPPAATPPATATDQTTDAARDTLDRASTSAKQALDRTQEGMSETWNDIKEATYDERATFQSSMQDLSARARQTVDELQTKYPTAAKAELQQAREKLDVEVAELRAATADTWNQARAEVAEAWESLQQELAEFRRENLR